MLRNHWGRQALAAALSAAVCTTPVGCSHQDSAIASPAKSEQLDRYAEVAAPPAPSPAPNQAEPPPLPIVQREAAAGSQSAKDRRKAPTAKSAELQGVISESYGAGAIGLSGSGRGGGGAMNYGSVGGSASYSLSGSSMAAKRIAVYPPDEEKSSESYKNYGVNAFTTAAEDHLSTFAVDVDTASYAIARRKVLEGTRPPADSVRVEEFVNYFRYDYPSPTSAPIGVELDAAPSPFDAHRAFLRVGLQGKKLALSERKNAHLVFLVDVSGSMQSPDKLPMAKRALRILVDNLRDGDTVGLVTYAGGVKEALQPTGLEKKSQIYEAIDALNAGGSTAMASGIDLAYAMASRTLTPDSYSRVIVLSDGDANVGPTSQEAIHKLIAGRVKEGVTLSVVGFGMGNYRDDLMEQLADKGNGNYAYVDSLMQARRVFQEQLGSTLEMIAQDVKVQVDFDPAVVKKYRLVGYENRDVADRDFRNDKVDAGEMGSGHTVTALYELEVADGAWGKVPATVRIRAKKPKGETADEWVFPFKPSAWSPAFADASKDFRFAVAVMGAAEIFRGSTHAKEWSLGQVEKIARAAAPAGNAERAEFVALVERAQGLFGGVAAR